MCFFSSDRECESSQFCQDEQCRSGTGRVTLSAYPQTAKGHGWGNRCSIKVIALLDMWKKGLELASALRMAKASSGPVLVSSPGDAE